MGLARTQPIGASTTQQIRKGLFSPTYSPLPPKSLDYPVNWVRIRYSTSVPEDKQLKPIFATVPPRKNAVCRPPSHLLRKLALRATELYTHEARRTRSSLYRLNRASGVKRAYRLWVYLRRACITYILATRGRMSPSVNAYRNYPCRPSHPFLQPHSEPESTLLIKRPLFCTLTRFSHARGADITGPLGLRARL